MKNLGERVREFRLAPGRDWSTSRMAREVGTSRQNIENLESKGFGQPRYIAKLAKVMGTTVDELLGRKVVAFAQADAPSAPELAHLAEYRRLSPDDQILVDEAIGELAKASAMRRKALHKIGLPTEAPAGAGNDLPVAPVTKAIKEKKNAAFNLRDKGADTAIDKKTNNKQ